MRNAILLLAIAMSAPGAAQAFVLKDDGAGNSVHWPTTPVVFAIDAAGPRDMPLAEGEKAVGDAFAQWSKTNDTELVLEYQGTLPGLTLGYDRADGAVNHNSVIWSRDEWDFEPDALAITLTLYRRGSGELVDSDILVNERAYVWGTNDQVENDIENAITHEVGHFLGLGHSEDAEATMYASARRFETKKRSLSLDDQAAILALYREVPTQAELAAAEPTPEPQRRTPTQAALPEDGSGPGCTTTGDEGAGLSGLLLLALAAVRRRRSPGPEVAHSSVTPRRKPRAGVFVAQVLSVFAVVAALASSANATLVQAFSLEDLSTFASKVVRARVATIESGWEGSLVFTNVKINIEECFKGPCEEQELTIRVLGGTVGDLVMDVQDVTRYSIDEEVMLFLEPVGRRWRTTGMAQGKFRIVDSERGLMALRAPMTVIGSKAEDARRLQQLPVTTLVQGVRRALGTKFRVGTPRPSEALAGSPYFKVRLATARALTGRDDPDSLNLLRRLTDDRHPLVRLAAVHGLTVHGGSVAESALTRARRDSAAMVRRYTPVR